MCTNTAHAPILFNNSPLSTASLQCLEDVPDIAEQARLRHTSSPIKILRSVTLSNGLSVQVPDDVDLQNPRVVEFISEVAGKATVAPENRTNLEVSQNV